jgi:site-specific recombinase XerD
MIATGIRVGELHKVRVDDVSPDGRSFRIHGKGARDWVAYVSDVNLRSDLEKLVEWHRGSGRAGGNLFLNRRALPMKPQSIRPELRRYSTRVGAMRRITPHMLRHTAATILNERGVDIRFVQRLLGHSSIATTEIYTLVSDEALRMTLERADDRAPQWANYPANRRIGRPARRRIWPELIGADCRGHDADQRWATLLPGRSHREHLAFGYDVRG